VPGNEFALGEGPGPAITEEEESDVGQVTITSTSLDEKEKAHVGQRVTPVDSFFTQQTPHQSRGAHSSRRLCIDSHILEPQYEEFLPREQSQSSGITHGFGLDSASFSHQAISHEYHRSAGGAVATGHRSISESGFVTMDGNLLNPRLAGTKARQIQDAKNMQSAVAERLTKKGLNVPPYEFLELIGKGSYGRVYKR
jgi:hypothetical protein